MLRKVELLVGMSVFAMLTSSCDQDPEFSHKHGFTDSQVIELQRYAATGSADAQKALSDQASFESDEDKIAIAALRMIALGNEREGYYSLEQLAHEAALERALDDPERLLLLQDSKRIATMQMSLEPADKREGSQNLIAVYDHEIKISEQALVRKYGELKSDAESRLLSWRHNIK